MNQTMYHAGQQQLGDLAGSPGIDDPDDRHGEGAVADLQDRRRADAQFRRRDPPVPVRVRGAAIRRGYFARRLSSIQSAKASMKVVKNLRVPSLVRAPLASKRVAAPPT